MKKLLVLAGLMLTACVNEPQKEPEVFVQPLVKINPSSENSAWWLRTEYFPSGKTINNIPVEAIQADWCFANIVTVDDYVKIISADDAKHLQDSSIVFQLNGKFDGSRNMEALPGVYQKCNGEKGNFILLSEIDDAKNEKIISVLEANKNTPSFIGLLAMPENMIGVALCLECDDFSALQWDSATNNLKWSDLH